jgi:hypothetical protein
MVELQAGLDFGGAAKRFYDRHRALVRIVVLCAAGIATGTTGALAAMQEVAPAAIAALLTGMILAGGVCFLQTRHPLLAATTALAPLPGLLWAAPISGGSEFGPVPVLAYAFAFSAAALTTETYVSRALGRKTVEYPWSAALAALVFALVMAVMWFGRGGASDAALQSLADSALAVLSALVLAPLALDLIPFDEAFVARSNRAHEWRRRLWEHMAKITIPRWALSFTGIAVIFLALGWYGSEPVLRHGPVLKGASVLLAVIGVGAFSRGWREAIACGLIGSVVCLFALWTTAVGTRAVLASVGVLLITVFAAFLALYGARRALVFARSGDPPLIAQRRALEDAGGPALAGAGAVAALLPSMAVTTGSTAAAIGLAFAAGAAVLLVPAASVALEVLVPRRRSVEELYGKARKPVR